MSFIKYIYVFINLCFFSANLFSIPLLNIIDQRLQDNPYTAYQMFREIDKNALLTSDDKTKYEEIGRAVLSFKLPTHKLGMASSHMSSLAADQEDLWVTDSLGTITRYSLNTGEATLIRKAQQSQNMQKIFEILIQDEIVWFLGQDYIMTYDKKDGTIFSNPLPHGGLPVGLVEYQDNLLLAIESQGIYLWNGQEFLPWQLSTQTLEGIQSLAVHKQTLWAGTAEGLFELTENSWRQVGGLESKNISYLGQNTQGLWAMTHDSELFLVNEKDSFASVVINMKDSRLFLLPDSALILDNKTQRVERIKNAYDRTVINLSGILANFSLLECVAFSSPYLIVGTTEDAAFFIHQDLL